MTPWTIAHQASRPWNSPGKNTGVDCHFILQGIFLTQGLNPGLLNCRQILYQLSHQGSPGEALKSHTIDEIRISFIWFDSGVEVLNHPTTCFCVCLPLCWKKAMATHSSSLAWTIPWTEEPGGLQSMGSLGVGHDWATSLSLFTFMHWRRKWQPTPVFLPGESQGQGSLVDCRLWGCTGLDMTEAT